MELVIADFVLYNEILYTCCRCVESYMQLGDNQYIGDFIIWANLFFHMVNGYDLDGKSTACDGL